MAFSGGKYWNETMTGNVFIGSTAAAGTTLPLATGTAMTFGVWNTSTDFNIVMLKCNIGFTSGTIALGEFGWTDVSATVVATGSNITAFTDGAVGTTIRNGIIGGGNASRMRFTPSAATIVASTACYWMGSAHEGATGVGPANTISHDFDGLFVLPPGKAAFLVGSIAQTALFSLSLAWSEVSRN